ncbi:hypothetical protein C8Q78DRAFT_794069 [Trametes maxima]|nr:hypothetical protein C8Q78DRAFT_794069 [Trametes maxima]
MIIKNVWIRHGIALLKPECVELKGHHTADRDEQRDAIFIRALKERLGEPLEDEPAAAPEPAGAPAPEHAPAQAAAPVPRSPLREISPPPAGAEAGPSQSPRRIEREHDDDAGQPRRRKRPSRAGRSPSLEPPPREAALQRSRYFSGPAGDVNGSASSETGANAAAATDDDGDRVRVETGEKRAMQDLARAIGLSQPRQAPLHLPSSDDDDENPFAPNASLPGAKKGADKGKGKGRAEPVFGEPGSEDYDFDFDFDDSFLEQVDRVEEEARLRAAASNPNGHGRANVNVNGKSDAQAPTQVKAEPRSQSVGTNKSLLSAATTLVGTQRPPAHRARSGTPAATAGVALGTSVGGGGVDVPMEVIDISDDEVEGDKENVPAPTRHVRRRVAPTLVDEDVIELSD